MDPLAHHFLTLAYNNAWANHRLLKVCSRLSQNDFSAIRTSFFPSISATLNHILTVDWFYIDALERSIRGEPINHQAWKFFEADEPYKTCDALKAQQRKTDQRLIAVCQTLDAKLLKNSVDISRHDAVQTEQMSRLLTHLFQHQIHHRGQVHAMLAGTPVSPPQLDEFFCADEAALRADDFQELGFSEQTIWASQ
ncbi:DinB family protein [Oscillatoria sp. CS-180]|uniref:DinB family protein n=1 Tax=Oscillatoria sp. CS-180 TaxID=3021720 RepID=UPI00232B334B|nr:DinB family protein [Oscillatoria sp. CS-180]MDB9528461.1 DinB family protein [Oscillatoria sp. CS-180]